VPSGGIPSGCVGLTEGGTIAPTVTGQIGGTSIELLQSGCISPSTQRQAQEAWHSAVSNNAKAAASNQRMSDPCSSLSAACFVTARAADNGPPRRMMD
jgi:hypothetical protein